MMYAIYCIKDDTIFNKTDDKNAVIEKCNQLNKDLKEFHGAKKPWYYPMKITILEDYDTMNLEVVNADEFYANWYGKTNNRGK